MAGCPVVGLPAMGLPVVGLVKIPAGPRAFADRATMPVITFGRRSGRCVVAPSRALFDVSIMLVSAPLGRTQRNSRSSLASPSGDLHRARLARGASKKARGRHPVMLGPRPRSSIRPMRFSAHRSTPAACKSLHASRLRAFWMSMKSASTSTGKKSGCAT